MGTKISWAAIAVAGSTFLAAGCQTAPEERPTASSASERGAQAEASASDTDRSERAGAMGTATTEQQSRSTEDSRADATAARQSDATGREAASATSGTPYEITGRVESVDESNIEIAGRTFKVDASTSVRKGGVGATLEDIKEGDEVRASLSGTDDAAKAVRIDVMSPKRDSPESSPAQSDTGADR